MVVPLRSPPLPSGLENRTGASFFGTLIFKPLYMLRERLEIMKIYIAGPFFNEEETRVLNLVIEIIRKSWPDAELFIPKEHFIESGDKMTNLDWARKVREMDLEAIKSCDAIIALYHGHYSDSGTAYELGYASALGKEIYIINTSIHTSLMITPAGKNLWLSEENKTITELNDRQVNLLINQK